MRLRSFALLLSLTAFTCGPNPKVDAPLDAGAMDAGASPMIDAGQLPDSGAPADGGAGPDAGPPPDAGQSSDAGQPHDAGQPADAGAPVDCGTFAPVMDPDSNGPFAITTEMDGPDCTVVRPATLGQGGVLHPVIIWGNGTSAPTSLYKPAFDYWATHGFIVAAANATNGQGSGAPQLACLQWLIDQNATSGSAYEGKVCPRVAATGHSQGGAGAIMCGVDTRVNVTAPLMPYTQQGWGGFETSSIVAQHATPMLMMSGTLDNNATPSVYQQPVFDTTNVPVFWANLIGADHYTAALGLTNYRGTMLRWFRLQLMDDQTYRDDFYGPSCTLCSDSKWIVQRKGF